ncbi:MULTISPECIES: hypothetical protein [unclassified Thioalkalivibrio]|uniref:type IVB secretion system protein IcmW n=1 Tax=unclassified Thioalkalivibrio TaxID=2621013 RepID=UPI00035FF9B4|nr:MULTISPECIES: hypothetical protein [unclassified Thioalkalivibrio]
MLRESDVEGFLDELEIDVRTLVEITMNNEGWPSDEDQETSSALEALSAKLDKPENRKILAETDPALLCGLLAMINLPRSFLTLREVVEQSPERIEELLNPAKVGLRVANLHVRTLLMRIGHIKRLEIARTIFSEERQAVILKALERDRAAAG